ncbi:MAG: hypothetical protein ACI9JE_000336, partial [Candidatus Krumholzibacteriia bacterium]
MLARHCRRVAFFSVLFALTLMVNSNPNRSIDQAVASEALQQVIAGGSSTEQYKVWVHFQDRTLLISDVDSALDQAEAALTPRAANRRAKMHAPGERLVDVRDLPLNRTLIEQCQKTGARLEKESRWLNAASFTANAQQVAQLTRTAGVTMVAPVRSMRRAAIPTPVGKPRQRDFIPNDIFSDKEATALNYGSNLAAMLQANVVAAHEVGLSGNGVLV